MDDKTKALWNGTNFPRGTLLFYTGGDVWDMFIRLDAGIKAVLGSGFYPTHVAVSLGNTQQAVCAWAGGNHCVMFRAQIDENSNLRNTLQARLLPSPFDSAQLAATMKSQLGKPYDYLGLAGAPLFSGLGIRLGGGPPKAFHCSSLVAWALAGMGVSFDKPLRAVTPNDLWARFQ